MKVINSVVVGKQNYLYHYKAHYFPTTKYFLLFIPTILNKDLPGGYGGLVVSMIALYLGDWSIMEFACSPCALEVSFECSGFLPEFKDMFSFRDCHL